MENDVLPESSPVISEDVTTQKPKGSKTPEANLYAALEEERRLRKEAEAKAKEAEDKLTTSDVFSDEGKVLEKKIQTLQHTLDGVLQDRETDDLKAQYPAIKDKWDEFDKFRADFPRHKLENVAKIFLAENGMLEEVPRKGLERPVAGPKTPLSTGMSVEDVTQLRTTNYRKYLEMLKEGKIDIK